MKKWLYITVLGAVLLVGCKQKVNEPEMLEGQAGKDVGEGEEQVVHAEVDQFEVELINVDGVGVGVATIHEEADGVHIEVEAHHLNPGVHGFHIHERGLCEAPTFESAGGHFNPTHKEHGFDNPKGPHAGDMENIEVEEDGTVKVRIVNKAVTLERGKENSLFQKEGTSLMIHADPDDYVSQPAGNAGERIVCGVIASPEKEAKN